MAGPAVSALLWTFYHIGLMICALDALRRRSIGRATFVVCMHFFISLVVRKGRPQPMSHNTGCSFVQGGGIVALSSGFLL